jgi:hypothetical protein
MTSLQTYKKNENEAHEICKMLLQMRKHGLQEGNQMLAGANPVTEVKQSVQVVKKIVNRVSFQVAPDAQQKQSDPVKDQTDKKEIVAPDAQKKHSDPVKDQTEKKQIVSPETTKNDIGSRVNGHFLYLAFLLKAVLFVIAVTCSLYALDILMCSTMLTQFLEFLFVLLTHVADLCSCMCAWILAFFYKEDPKPVQVQEEPVVDPLEVAFYGAIGCVTPIILGLIGL